MSKYDALWVWIKEKGIDGFKLTFAEIQQIAGLPIDHSFLKYKKELRQTMKKNKHTASIGESRILLCGYHEKQCCKKRQKNSFLRLDFNGRRTQSPDSSFRSFKSR